MRTSKTVEHLALNCPYYHRNAIIADIVNLYGGRHGRTIIFCETKKISKRNIIESKFETGDPSFTRRYPTKTKVSYFPIFQIR